MTKGLEDFRVELDRVDEKLISLLSERFKITREVGKYKREHNLSALDESRENLIYKKLEREALEYNIDSSMLKAIWKNIMTQSKKEHEKL